MATEFQIQANQANAQHSTGPKTDQGKAISCQNRRRHGFAGVFHLLDHEDPEEYETMLTEFIAEHQPTSMTEHVLIERMTQHQWLVQRALQLQTAWFESSFESHNGEPTFALYLRYQTSNERAFSKCLHDLLKLRSERRKAEIGFESQERKRNQEERKRNQEELAKAEHLRKQSIEDRKLDLHKMEVWLAEAKAEHQELLNFQLETPEMHLPNRVKRIIARQQAA